MDWVEWFGFGLATFGVGMAVAGLLMILGAQPDPHERADDVPPYRDDADSLPGEPDPDAVNWDDPPDDSDRPAEIGCFELNPCGRCERCAPDYRAAYRDDDPHWG